MPARFASRLIRTTFRGRRTIRLLDWTAGSPSAKSLGAAVEGGGFVFARSRSRSKSSGANRRSTGGGSRRARTSRCQHRCTRSNRNGVSTWPASAAQRRVWPRLLWPRRRESWDITFVVLTTPRRLAEDDGLGASCCSVVPVAMEPCRRSQPPFLTPRRIFWSPWTLRNHCAP